MTKIDVTYVSLNGTSIRSEEISGHVYSFKSMPPIEEPMRDAIASASDQTAAALQDLYRGLVLSNFARLNGRGGKQHVRNSIGFILTMEPCLSLLSYPDDTMLR